jgi:chromosome segregation ATPase
MSFVRFVGKSGKPDFDKLHRILRRGGRYHDGPIQTAEVTRMRQPNFSLQPLECRRMLHAGPHVGVTAAGVLDECPEVTEARSALQDVVKQLRADQRAGRTTLKDDRDAIVEELRQLADEKGEDAVKEALQPLKDKLRADEKAKFKELRAAGEELRTAKRDARKTLFADLQALRAARLGGDQDAIDAAQAKLDADKAKVQEDLNPIRDDIIAIRDKYRPIITADHDAIQAKLEELNPDLAPLFDKLETDANALHDKLMADQEKVTTAGADLKTAIADCLAEHPDGDHTETTA